jgi:DNA-binding PadR family transcriptional regulator
MTYAETPSFGGYGRRRHRHRHGMLMFGGKHRPGRGEFPFGRGGRRAGRGDIRAAILALLSEQPMHGYQIMQELSERTGGVWRPSPGSIYPTLQLLQDEGLVRGEELEAGRRLFHLTEAGVAAAAAAPKTPTPWQTVAEEGDPSAVELHDLVRQLAIAARQVLHAGGSREMSQAMDVLREARRKLYRILADEPQSDADADKDAGTDA